MRISFAIFAFLIICLVAVVQSQGQGGRGRVCTPGETWKESCRTCTCSPKGMPICPRILCPGADGFIRVDLPPMKPAEDDD
uniref:Pacifastin domain-containing protein n=1 Tax=Riptortus pedestris TaxID=329032 RepID=R4WCP6_RIPPE|nr:unknown secreted protein [Riptortus pedestris]